IEKPQFSSSVAAGEQPGAGSLKRPTLLCCSTVQCQLLCNLWCGCETLERNTTHVRETGRTRGFLTLKQQQRLLPAHDGNSPVLKKQTCENKTGRKQVKQIPG
ncbi:MAG: hypothetical protein ACO35C_07090, partial [Pontimonas sp.]